MKNKPTKVTYKPKEIEAKWQAKWQETGIYQPDLETARRPFYNLMMFPYPSAEGLHVGNMYAMTGADVYGRFCRMQGEDVFEPIGLDGFGIHSENYALKVGRHPMKQAEISEKNFYRQMQAIGNGFAWKNRLETYDPDYYKWTQWLFTELFKQGLAYRKSATVNFCPSCKTVLSDEQVVAGECERCGSVVEKRELKQWFFRITKYAGRLLENLDKIDWAEKVKVAQRNWIGRSEGARIRFKMEDLGLKSVEEEENQKSSATTIIEVFTTRPDTLYGATFMVVAPEHPVVTSLLGSKFNVQSSKLQEVKEYIDEASHKSDSERTEEKEKTGVFTGLSVTNPVSGEAMPVWVADYVLMGYGTGAIMAVPAHDERDFAFAKKYNLPIKQVIAKAGNEVDLDKAFTGSGVLIQSGDWNGWEMLRDAGKVLSFIEEKGIGERTTTYHLRDWLISRQRYWGPPIPMIYCEACAEKGVSWFDTEEGKKLLVSGSEYVVSSKKGIQHTTFRIQDTDMAGWFPVPLEDLPVKLPVIDDYRPLGTGMAPLANHPEFYETTCPECGGKARRETDVSDTFLDSAWYFLRYLATDWNDMPFPSVKYAEEKERGPAGYHRHSTSLTALHPEDAQWGALPPVTRSDEAEDREVKIEKSEKRSRYLPVSMYIGGAEHAVLHLLYARFITMVLQDAEYIDFEEPFTRFFAHGLIIKDGAKMSKSKGNVVVPDEYIAKYGADTLRSYLMFLGPFTDGGDFSDTGLEGMGRFLKRVWTLVTGRSISGAYPSESARRFLHQTIAGVTDDMASLRYNTAMAKLMKFYNHVSKEEILTKEEVRVFVQMLAPLAPHMTEELWERLGEVYSVHTNPWPEYDKKYLMENVITVVVQVNGRMRESVEIEREQLTDKIYVEKKARESEKVARQLAGKDVRKVIYVPGKILNFVVT